MLNKINIFSTTHWRHIMGYECCISISQDPPPQPPWTQTHVLYFKIILPRLFDRICELPSHAPSVPLWSLGQVLSRRPSRNKHGSQHSIRRRNAGVLSLSAEPTQKHPFPALLLFSSYFLPESVCKTLYGIGKLFARLLHCSLPNSIAIICKLPP